jgi:HD-like signal output (HDOD) protein
MPLKPSSLAWVRLNSSPLIRAVRPAVARAFVAAILERTGKLQSLDDLEPDMLDRLNHALSKQSNDALETQFLEFVKGRKS